MHKSRDKPIKISETGESLFIYRNHRKEGYKTWVN